MTITFLGHTTFHIILDNGKGLLIDPWILGNPACPDHLKTDIYPIDYILVSQGHVAQDEIVDTIPLSQQYPEAKLITNSVIARWMEKRGLQNIQALNYGGTYEFSNTKITYVKAVHASSITEYNSSVPDGGAGGFIIQEASGFTLYFTGDTALTLEMKLIAEFYQPNLAILPIGGVYTMGPRAAAMACKFIACESVIPCHYGTFPRLTGTPEQFGEEVNSLGVNTKIFALLPGEEIRFPR